MADNGIRINKFISDAGLASRRGADQLIADGRVTIRKAGEGSPISVTSGERVMPGDEVYLDGTLIENEKSGFTYIMLNKPVGIICTGDRRTPDNVMDFLTAPEKVTYVGRLDKESSGLLLMTDDGELNNEMMRAARGHEKEYLVTVNKPLSEDFLRQMRSGVVIMVPDKQHVEHEVKTRPCKVRVLGEKRFAITLTQGLNRQIRRMCRRLGYKVLSLKRVRLMSLKLGSLPEGQWRYLTEDEVVALKKEVEKRKTDS